MAAEIIPIDRSDKALVKEEYTEAIRLWCKSRDTAEILTREEIGAMQKFDRIDAQRKAIILSLSHYYRKHERADVAPGLAVVITLMSDNDRGSSSISQPMLAKLFGRSLSSIGDAIRRLKEDGIIITGRGRYPATYPVIPRAVTAGYNHLTWLVGAVCNQDEPTNLPDPSVDCQTTGPVRGLSQSTGPTGDLKKLNPPVEPVSIHRGDRCQIHYSNSAVLCSGAHERESGKAAPLKVAASIAIGMMAATGSALPAAANPPAPPRITQPAKPSLDEMIGRMTDAAGAAISRGSNLLMWSDLQQWLASGCDFELDILPTIRSVAARQLERGGGQIGAWAYFTKAISNARALRLAPMPDGRAPSGMQQPPQRSFAQQRADAERESLARDVERIRARGPARPLCEQIEDLGDLA